MAGQSRGLGRGLQALLSAQTRPAVAAAEVSGGTLPIAAIQAGDSQPRKSIQQPPLEGLAASIKANGVIQPIVVRPLGGASVGSPGYEIVAGERRWQAAQLAGLTDIPVVIRELSDQEAVAIALIENIQREELTPAEEARSLQRLIGEFSLTHQEAAAAVGRSRAAVSNLIRLLDLPAEVVSLIDSKGLSMGHARALLGLEDDAERVRLGRLVAERGLSVRETEKLVRKALTAEGSAPLAKPPELAMVTEILRTTALHVQLHQRVSGAGKLIVEFSDASARDVIVAAIKSAVEE
jgi:ParB family transcriptional regulator, chromosome partitioning protein